MISGLRRCPLDSGEETKGVTQNRRGRAVGWVGPSGRLASESSDVPSAVSSHVVSEVTCGQCPQSPKKQGLEVGCTFSPTTTYGDA